MTRFEALVSLNMVLEIGSIRLNKLLEFFGSAENILKAEKEKLTQVFGIGEGIAAKIRALNKEDLERELAQAKKYGLKIITIDDASYPQNLKNIYDPPIVLYIKGEIRQQDCFSLAIVGSRRSSYYGLSSAEKFGFGLAQAGLTIVSGMARGVDTYAHCGALKAGGRTLAVIGSGWQNIYPEENISLAERIAENGAVISEFPINTKPFRQNFPRRNRVISGLSLGTLVVEAARNSGALITADFALEQGRDVFALPGMINSDNSFGTNELIKQGAKLVSSIEDILEELNLAISNEIACLPDRQVSSPACGGAPRDDNASSKEEKENGITAQEKLVYDALQLEPLHIDEIAEKTKLAISRITAILFKLQMKHLIRQLPGSQFVRATHEEEKFSYC